eukprot:272329_1
MGNILRKQTPKGAIRNKYVSSVSAEYVQSLICIYFNIVMKHFIDPVLPSDICDIICEYHGYTCSHIFTFQYVQTYAVNNEPKITLLKLNNHTNITQCSSFDIKYDYYSNQLHEKYCVEEESACFIKEFNVRLMCDKYKQYNIKNPSALIRCKTIEMAHFSHTLFSAIIFDINNISDNNIINGFEYKLPWKYGYGPLVYSSTRQMIYAHNDTRSVQAVRNGIIRTE